MRTRGIAIMVVLCLLTLAMSAAASTPFEDVAEDHPYAEAITAMSDLGVLEGHGDGTFEPEGILNRAQAAKVAALLMGLTQEDAEAAEEEDHFTDVGSDMPANLIWARGWINLMAERDIILGYGDNSFGPSDTLTISQWFTILVRILGYETEEMKADWPAAYDGKAAELGLDEGIDYDGYRDITRAEMAKSANTAIHVEMAEGGTIAGTVFGSGEAGEEESEEEEPGDEEEGEE